MKPSSKFFVSSFIGLFFGIIGTVIFFVSLNNDFLSYNPIFQIIIGSVLVPSLTVVFTILAYLILPKND